MQVRKSKQLYYVTLVYANGMTRSVPVRAVTREVAERKALKRNPSATGVKHDA